MKKTLWLTGLLLITGLGYIAASPYITVDQIKTGIDEQDSESLAQNIDFPVLRKNLKEQLNAQVMKKTTSELKNNPFGALALGFASTLVDGMVDSFITPSGLASLTEGKKPSRTESSDSKASSGAQRQEPFKDARYSYDSANSFSVWVQDLEGKEIRFVLLRYGINWKLTNIIFPVAGQ